MSASQRTSSVVVRAAAFLSCSSGCCFLRIPVWALQTELTKHAPAKPRKDLLCHSTQKSIEEHGLEWRKEVSDTKCAANMFLDQALVRA